MITFAQKPGIFSYWVTQHHYTKLAGNIVQENRDGGWPRFQRADLLGLWKLPFIKIFKDGDHWCALVGDDIQEGIAEFTPITDRDEFDQITDFGHEYVRAHRDTKYGDRFEYWLPHEIEMMAEQARASLALTRPQSQTACTWPNCDQPSGHDYCYDHCLDATGRPTAMRPHGGTDAKAAADMRQIFSDGDNTHRRGGK